VTLLSTVGVTVAALGGLLWLVARPVRGAVGVDVAPS
jgi:hypothetical protein